MVLARDGDFIAAFMIGRYPDGWRYVPAAAFGPTAVEPARSSLAGVTAFVATSGPNDTGLWWLLGKGASGAAVQNMRLMLGLSEG